MFFNSFLQDVRVGFRVLIKEKSFCILAVLVLGLGICGVTTQFAVVNGIVLRGFSFPHPEQLMGVGLIDSGATPQQNNFGAGNIPSTQDYEDLRAAQQSFAQMAAYLNGSTINVSYRGNPQRYTGGYVTEDFFKIIGVTPILGRDFTAEEDKPGAEKTAILGHEIWQRDFGGDPKIVGQAVRINGKSATIIGVMPPRFKFPVNEELWVPLLNEFPMKPRGDPAGLGPSILGRLKPGVSVDQANAEFVGLAKRLAKDNPKTNGQLVSASVQPLTNVFTGPQLRQTVFAMLAAVIIVLLIACVNVMNMQFGRVALRAKELAIRGALGATRRRLVRQMMTESLLVAVLRALRGSPEFEKAAMTGRFRMTFGAFGPYEVDGQTYMTDRDRPQGNSEAVSDGYFASIGLKVLEGRDFTIDDNDAKQPVAIVNSSFARKYFGHESPLGRRIRAFDPAQPKPWRTIVGVVPDTLMQGPFNQQTDNSGFYVPLLRTDPAPQFVTVVVRPHPGQNAETLATPLAKAVAELDTNLPTYFGGTPARLHDEQLSGFRIIASLFTIFGFAAFVLAAVGLYGVMSFSVNQRTQQFGIRMALGADGKRILRMVMTQGAWQLAIGLVLGSGAAAILLSLIGPAALQNFLFKVNALDPVVYCTVAASLTLVAAASCFIPPRRATRVNPIVALRAE